MKKLITTLAIAMMLTANAFGQDLPSCNIYLFRTSMQDSVLSLTDPQF
ncbi:MAG: hypothetical protein IPM82_19800 [Saprospiraceae bacterium]|nr:hypothetical protein [Saprospiraceae bacterium]